VSCQGGTAAAIVAEHSMGIYAALASVGSISEADALELTSRIGRALARMGKGGRYALACIIGLPATSVLALAENNGVYPANFNTSRHFLLAGEQHCIEAATAEAAGRRGVQCQQLPVPTPRCIRRSSEPSAAICGKSSLTTALPSRRWRSWSI